jgi:hypothetical protein
MNGTTFDSSINLGAVAISWNIAGSSDFNGDYQSDILWQTVHWPKPYLAHERHHAYVHGQFGNRGDVVEHRWLERLNGDAKSIFFANSSTGQRLICS